MLVHQAGLFSSAVRSALSATADVRVWEGLPPARAVAATDIVVVDLDPLAGTIDPGRLRSFLTHASLFLVVGDRPIEPEWVELTSNPHVRTIRCGAGARATGSLPIVAELAAKLRGPSAEQVATLVLDPEPALRPLAHLVGTICADPWRVRRPRDLAHLSEGSLAQVKKSCASVGFSRVEHFIICVRAVAYEQLVARSRVPMAVARQLAGLRDVSNLRRHLRRALARSPRAASVLRTLRL